MEIDIKQITMCGRWVSVCVFFFLYTCISVCRDKYISSFGQPLKRKCYYLNCIHALQGLEIITSPTPKNTINENSYVDHFYLSDHKCVWGRGSVFVSHCEWYVICVCGWCVCVEVGWMLVFGGWVGG